MRNTQDVIAQLTLAIETLAESIAQVAPGSRENPPDPNRPQSLTERAVHLVLSQGIASQAELARRLGVHRSSISRLPKVRAAILYTQVMAGNAKSL